MHFCTSCEAGTPHRDPVPEQGTAICTQCGTENKIPCLPLQAGIEAFKSEHLFPTLMAAVYEGNF